MEPASCIFHGSFCLDQLVDPDQDVICIMGGCEKVADVLLPQHGCDLGQHTDLTGIHWSIYLDAHPIRVKLISLNFDPFRNGDGNILIGPGEDEKLGLDHLCGYGSIRRQAVDREWILKDAEGEIRHRDVSRDNYTQSFDNGRISRYI